MKDPRDMTNAEIQRTYNKLQSEGSRITQKFIDEGRGHERPSDYAHKTDTLSRRANENSDKLRALFIEVELRYGPGMSIRHMPRGGARR